MTSPRPPVLLKGAHSAPTITTLRRSPSARTTGSRARARWSWAWRARGARGAPKEGAKDERPRVARPETEAEGGHGGACEVARVVEVAEDGTRQSRTSRPKRVRRAVGRDQRGSRLVRTPRWQLIARAGLLPRSDARGEKNLVEGWDGGEEKPFRGALVSLEVQSNTTPRASNAIPRALAARPLRRSIRRDRRRAHPRAPRLRGPRAHAFSRVFLDDPTPEMLFPPRDPSVVARARDRPPPRRPDPPLPRPSFQTHRVAARSPLRVSAAGSFLSDVDQAPPTPSSACPSPFARSTNPNKLNLGVGAYRTEELKPYVLDVVKRAERLMIEADYDKEYLPMQGLAEFNAATVELLLGATTRTPSPTSASPPCNRSPARAPLRVGAAFIAKFLPGKAVYLPESHLGQSQEHLRGLWRGVGRVRVLRCRDHRSGPRGDARDVEALPMGRCSSCTDARITPRAWTRRWTSGRRSRTRWKRRVTCPSSTWRTRASRAGPARGRRRRASLRRAGHRVLLRAVVLEESRPVRRARGRHQRGPRGRGCGGKRRCRG